MKTLRMVLSGLESFAHQHELAFRRAHHATHMTYFGLVAIHGAYDLAAMVMLALTLVSWAFHLELEGE